MKEVATIASDFDSIAGLPEKKWDHNSYFFKYLLKQISDSNDIILEVGCGKGELLSLLSSKCNQAIGLDISENMIDKALLKKNDSTIEFYNEDYFNYPLKENSVDVIISVATVHHLDFELFLKKAKQELKPEGKLIILDLYEIKFWDDLFVSIISKILDVFYNIIYNKRLFKTKIEKKYWQEHSKNDTFLALEEIATKANLIIPSAKVKKHLFWRYSLIWVK